MKESVNNASSSTEEILDTKEMEEDNINNLKNVENHNDEVQIEQEKVKMNLVNLNLSLTKAADVLHTTDIADRENYTLVQFQIRVRAVYLYKWVVYHKPILIRMNFKEISDELKKKSVELNDNIKEIFSKVQEMNTESIEGNLKTLE